VEKTRPGEEDAWRSNAVRPLELLVELNTAAYSPETLSCSGCCEGLLTSHVDVCGVAENTPRISSAEREAVGVNAVGMWALRTSSLSTLVLASAFMRLTYGERDLIKTIKLHVIHFYIVFLGSFGEVRLVCV
jgi:hypothetical protein